MQLSQNYSTATKLIDEVKAQKLTNDQVVDELKTQRAQLMRLICFAESFQEQQQSAQPQQAAARQERHHQVQVRGVLSQPPHARAASFVRMGDEVRGSGTGAC